MSVMPYATVVGVFRDQSAADLAMDALTKIGFKREQMRCLVASPSNGFFDNLKNAFKATNPQEEKLVSNLTDMGLSAEEAGYFSDEYAQGSAILAIKTQGDEEMAVNILHEYGAHNARNKTHFGGVMPGANPHSPSTWSADDRMLTSPTTMQSQEAQPLPQTVENHSTQDHQQEEVAANSHIEVHLQPIQPGMVGLNPQAYSIEVTRSPQSVSTLEEEVQDSEEPSAQKIQSDELPQLQAQIEAVRQQLQEARAELESAKGRESQLTTARLQLDDLQTELQATQAELQATRQRIITSEA